MRPAFGAHGVMDVWQARRECCVYDIDEDAIVVPEVFSKKTEATPKQVIGAA